MPPDESGRLAPRNIAMTPPILIKSSDAHYPSQLGRRLSHTAPTTLSALGNLGLLALSKTALFCSARCPGRVILTAYDQAARWRDAGRCIISGFHSPVEKECLRILLRGSPPIIMCPARALPQHVLPEWRKPMLDGRLLIISAFAARQVRITSDLSARRNEFVAALADEVCIVHATAGGHLETLHQRLCAWGIRLCSPQP